MFSCCFGETKYGFKIFEFFLEEVEINLYMSCEEMQKYNEIYLYVCFWALSSTCGAALKNHLWQCLGVLWDAED